MKKADIEIFKVRLREERKTIIHNLPQFLRTQSDHGPVEGDVLDVAVGDRDRELALTMSERDREKLHEIEAVLERIEDGTYGLCEDCGENIPMGRLQAKPHARRCVACKFKEEKRRKSLGASGMGSHSAVRAS